MNTLKPLGMILDLTVFAVVAFVEVYGDSERACPLEVQRELGGGLSISSAPIHSPEVHFVRVS